RQNARPGHHVHWCRPGRSHACRARLTTHTVLRSSMTLPSHIGVLGGGRMGAGIAHAFLTSGAHVTVVEQHDDAATAARDRVLRDVTGSVERGKVEGSVADYETKLTVTTEHTAFANAGLVLEA